MIEEFSLGAKIVQIFLNGFIMSFFIPKWRMVFVMEKDSRSSCSCYYTHRQILPWYYSVWVLVHTPEHSQFEIRKMLKNIHSQWQWLKWSTILDITESRIIIIQIVVVEVVTILLFSGLYKPVYRYWLYEKQIFVSHFENRNGQSLQRNSITFLVWTRSRPLNWTKSNCFM